MTMIVRMQVSTTTNVGDGLTRTCMTFLLGPRERLRSIVMSASVCLSVCPTGYLRNHTRDLYQFFVHVAYVRGSVVLLHVYDRPHRLSPGMDFLLH